jgi:hypothetical protein
MNQMISAKDKTFEIKFCSESYFFSREQIILISRKAFLQISSASQSFNVLASSNIPKKSLLFCFNKIFSLFSSSEEIIISQHNVRAFHYVSEVLENSDLLSICQNVLLSGHPQSFFLDSS